MDVQTLMSVTYTNLVTKWGKQLKIKASSHNLLLNEIYITAHINSQSERDIEFQFSVPEVHINWKKVDITIEHWGGYINKHITLKIG